MRPSTGSNRLGSGRSRRDDNTGPGTIRQAAANRERNEQARFEAARAFRQDMPSIPATGSSRLISNGAGTSGVTVLRSQEDLTRLNTATAPRLNTSDRERLMALGNDLSLAWDRPGVTVETRKKIVRMLISEIIVDITDDTITTIIHWHGGDHTRFKVKKNKAGQTRWSTSADIIELVQVLARQMSDTSIAAALNRSGKTTGRGNGWSRASVCSFRHQRDSGLP